MNKVVKNWRFSFPPFFFATLKWRKHNKESCSKERRKKINVTWISFAFSWIAIQPAGKICFKILSLPCRGQTGRYSLTWAGSGENQEDPKYFSFLPAVRGQINLFSRSKDRLSTNIWSSLPSSNRDSHLLPFFASSGESPRQYMYVWV
jgi:hypothetical protein